MQRKPFAPGFKVSNLLLTTQEQDCPGRSSGSIQGADGTLTYSAPRSSSITCACHSRALNKPQKNILRRQVGFWADREQRPNSEHKCSHVCQGLGWKRRGPCGHGGGSTHSHLRTLRCSPGSASDMSTRLEKSFRKVFSGTHSMGTFPILGLNKMKGAGAPCGNQAQE